MHCYIGGACSGRRALIRQRHPQAHWAVLSAGDALTDLLTRLPACRSGSALVIDGWTPWLTALLAETADDDQARAVWQGLIDGIAGMVSSTECAGLEVVLVLDEMGRGLVPMRASDRRLRDHNGWLVQAAVRGSACVWLVRHGLCLQLAPAGGDRQAVPR